MWLRVEQVCVLRHRSGEGMMSRLQLLWLLLSGQKEGKVHNPEEVKSGGIPERHATGLQQLRTLQSKMTQQRALRDVEWAE